MIALTEQQNDVLCGYVRYFQDFGKMPKGLVLAEKLNLKPNAIYACRQRLINFGFIIKVNDFERIRLIDHVIILDRHGDRANINLDNYRKEKKASDISSLMNNVFK